MNEYSKNIPIYRSYNNFGKHISINPSVTNPIQGESNRNISIYSPLSNKCNISSNYYVNMGLSPLPFMQKYVNEEVVQNALDTNPRITEILKEHGITPKISMKNINSQLKNHMFTSYIYAKAVARHQKIDSKSKETLLKAALVHDIGKALIPEEIIQKPGRLTEDERKIVDLHAELGAEIIKTTDLGDDVAELTRLHHKPGDNKLAKILSSSDFYSALRQRRSYKEPLSHTESIDIMKKSNVSEDIIQAIMDEFDEEMTAIEKEYGSVYDYIALCS